MNIESVTPFNVLIFTSGLLEPLIRNEPESSSYNGANQNAVDKDHPQEKFDKTNEMKMQDKRETGSGNNKPY